MDHDKIEQGVRLILEGIGKDPGRALVLIQAERRCMSMRGVRTPGTRTVTSAVRGLIQSHDATRAEAFSLINSPR